VPALPPWLTDPLWDQFAALLPDRDEFDPTHPLGCHRRRIADRIVFDKLLQVLRFGCSYQGIADSTCSATTIRDRPDEWIKLGVFTQLRRIALEAYDRVVGLLLDNIAIDGCITKAPGGGEVAGPSPVDRRKQGMKRSVLVEGYGIPLGRVLAGAHRHDSPLLGPTLDLLDDLGPLPDHLTVHLDAGYDSGKTRNKLAERGMHGDIAHKGDKAPIQAGQRWHVERTNAWHNTFNRLQRCYERREAVVDAFFDLADTIITVRSLIRRVDQPPLGHTTRTPAMNSGQSVRPLRFRMVRNRYSLVRECVQRRLRPGTGHGQP
jgi:transposase